MWIGCACGAGIKIPFKTARKLLIEEAEQFCSASCLLSYIKGFEGKPHASWVSDSSAAKLPLEGKDVWDEDYRMFFRSKYEIDVARFLTLSKIEWKYEAYTLWMGIMQYTPDFYLPLSGFMLEVKGRWLGSGKKKFRKAIKKGYPLLLISEHIIKDIRKCVSSMPTTNQTGSLLTP